MCLNRKRKFFTGSTVIRYFNYSILSQLFSKLQNDPKYPFSQSCTHIYMHIAVSGRCTRAYIYAHHAQRVNGSKPSSLYVFRHPVTTTTMHSCKISLPLINNCSNKFHSRVTIHNRTPAIIGRSYTETKLRRYLVMLQKGSPPFPVTEKWSSSVSPRLC